MHGRGRVEIVAAATLEDKNTRALRRRLQEQNCFHCPWGGRLSAGAASSLVTRTADHGANLEEIQGTALGPTRRRWLAPGADQIHDGPR